MGNGDPDDTEIGTDKGIVEQTPGDHRRALTEGWWEGQEQTPQLCSC